MGKEEEMSSPYLRSPTPGGAEQVRQLQDHRQPKADTAASLMSLPPFPQPAQPVQQQKHGSGAPPGLLQLGDSPGEELQRRAGGMPESIAGTVALVCDPKPAQSEEQRKIQEQEQVIKDMSEKMKKQEMY